MADARKRITRNPEIYAGKPIIRGQRLAVEHILDMLAAGSSPEELVAAYDWLEVEDIRACLKYAERAVHVLWRHSRRVQRRRASQPL
jgi:uncharacterized protein (DUF433 family)